MKLKTRKVFIFYENQLIQRENLSSLLRSVVFSPSIPSRYSFKYTKKFLVLVLFGIIIKKMKDVSGDG